MKRLKEEEKPARHLRFIQDEWFYEVDGEFMFEVGETNIILSPANFWLLVMGTYNEGTGNRILITFIPAGKMEYFFREVTKKRDASAGSKTMFCACYGIAGTAFSNLK